MGAVSSKKAQMTEWQQECEQDLFSDLVKMTVVFDGLGTLPLFCLEDQLLFYHMTFNVGQGTPCL